MLRYGRYGMEWRKCRQLFAFGDGGRSLIICGLICAPIAPEATPIDWLD